MVEINFKPRPWVKRASCCLQQRRQKIHCLSGWCSLFMNISHDFSSSHVQMWELDHKEGWVPKNWCFGTVMLVKTPESPLDSKEIKLVNNKGIQHWIFIGRTDAEAEAPILGSPDTESWLTGKDPDAQKDWRQEEKGMTEDEMFWWHHWLNGHEFEQTPGDGEGQGSLVAAVHGVPKSQTGLSNWTTIINVLLRSKSFLNFSTYG